MTGRTVSCDRDSRRRHSTSHTSTRSPTHLEHPEALLDLAQEPIQRLAVGHLEGPGPRRAPAVRAMTAGPFPLRFRRSPSRAARAAVAAGRGSRPAERGDRDGSGPRRRLLPRRRVVHNRGAWIERAYRYWPWSWLGAQRIARATPCRNRFRHYELAERPGGPDVQLQVQPADPFVGGREACRTVRRDPPRLPGRQASVAHVR